MPAPSKILWTLDNEVSPKQFERLCVDLLMRNGYHGIVPIGGHHDHGRDAEIRYWNGANRIQIPTVFQFSLEAKWEQKLRRDTPTILEHSPATKVIVFVTSREASGRKQDELREEFRRTVSCELIIYGREWFRIQLEEIHQDLALRHLSIDLPPTVGSAESIIIAKGLDDESATEIFRHTSPELLRATLVGRTQKDAADSGAWHALAQVEYHLRHYDEALRSVNKACNLAPENVNATLLKGAILAEMGIAAHSRPLLLQAKPIFLKSANKLNRSLDHYNLANVMVELREYEDAEKHYRMCLAIEPTAHRAWKNLGSLLSRKGAYEEEMACYDKALSLKPDLVEALLCKGTTFCMFLDEPAKAIECFTHAYSINADLDRRWKHARYWFAVALMDEGRMTEAFVQVELGLANAPDNMYLLNQKAAILASLWKTNPSYEKAAYEFYQFRATAIPNDYPGLDELIQIANRRSATDEVWFFVEQTLEAGGFSIKDLAGRIGISLDDLRVGCEHFGSYKKFRQCSQVDDHFIWLHNYGLHPNREIRPALFQLLLIPYAKTESRLQVMTQMQPEVLEKLFRESLEQIARIFCAFGGEWLAPEVPSDVEGRSELLAKGMYHLVDVIVAEASRQIGFMAGRRLMKTDRILPDSKSREWTWLYQDVARRLIENATEAWMTP